MQFVDDPAEALIDSIVNFPGPKIAIFPDSFPAQLESAYVAARFCGSTSDLAKIQDAAGKQYHLAEAYLSALYERGCQGSAKNAAQAQLRQQSAALASDRSC
jgi:hypothetical protein